MLKFQTCRPIFNLDREVNGSQALLHTGAADDGPSTIPSFRLAVTGTVTSLLSRSQQAASPCHIRRSDER